MENEAISIGANYVHHSPTMGELAEALADAQLEFLPVLKESENPAFMRGGKASKYADMHSLISATRPALANNGLVIIQSPSTRGKELVLTSMLLHSSGEWISHELVIPCADERGYTAHSIGKAMTYARRYSWQSLIGAAAEDDDDANEASGVGSKSAAQAVGQKKIEEFKEKMGNGQPPKIDGMVVDHLTIYYTWYDASQTALITLTPEMLEKHKKVIHALTTKVDGKLIADGEQLSKLEYEFEKIGVPFKKFKTVPVKAAGA